MNDLRQGGYACRRSSAGKSLFDARFGERKANQTQLLYLAELALREARQCTLCLTDDEFAAYGEKMFMPPSKSSSRASCYLCSISGLRDGIG